MDVYRIIKHYMYKVGAKCDMQKHLTYECLRICRFISNIILVKILYMSTGIMI